MRQTRFDPRHKATTEQLPDETGVITVHDGQCKLTGEGELLVLEATVGQNALSQVEVFRNIAGVTGLVMTKLDGTARGGILVAIAAPVCADPVFDAFNAVCTAGHADYAYVVEAAEKNGWAQPTEPLYFVKTPNSHAAHGAPIHTAHIPKAIDLMRGMAHAPEVPYFGQALLDEILAEMSVEVSA